MGATRTSPSQELALIEAARGGDQEAYRRMVEDRQGELHAHCYRMLGSFHDADDALQDALLRAWRGLPRFDGRSSLRTWLYRIATNTSLDVIARRPSRVLPIDRGPATDPHEPLAEPVTESAWIEAYPDSALGEGPVTPESRYEHRESVELAFVAAYSDAMERGDVDAVIAMLTEDATWSMPPLPCWFAGHDGVAGFLSRYAFSVAWRHLPARANGQVAVGCYARDPVSGRYVASVLDVLSVAGGRISAVTAFATADVFRRLARPEGPYVVSELFARIGLPPELPAR